VHRVRGQAVLIAILLVLGVDVVVVLALVLFVVMHNRWLLRQPGEFAGAIRVATGDVEGLRSRWSLGSGRWVRGVLVWSGAPLKLRNTIIGIDEVGDARLARGGEVKRLGKHPVVAQLVVDHTVVEIAADSEARDRLVGHTES
jgi:hypothetical protein